MVTARIHTMINISSKKCDLERYKVNIHNFTIASFVSYMFWDGWGRGRDSRRMDFLALHIEVKASFLAKTLQTESREHEYYRGLQNVRFDFGIPWR